MKSNCDELYNDDKRFIRELQAELNTAYHCLRELFLSFTFKQSWRNTFSEINMEDMVHDALIYVMERFRKGKYGTDSYNMLYIAKRDFGHIIIDYYRKNKIAKNQGKIDNFVRLEGIIRKNEQPGFDDVKDEDKLKKLRQEREKLSEEDKTILDLKYEHNYSNNKIGEFLNIEEDSAKNRVYRILTRIRKNTKK